MLKQINRLKKNKEFSYIYRKGKTIRTKNFLIYYVKTNCNASKFGVVVGKKIGKSVVRSRIKRLIVEAIRLNIAFFAIKNYVIIPNENVLNLGVYEIADDLIKAIKKENLFIGEGENV